MSQMVKITGSHLSPIIINVSMTTLILRKCNLFGGGDEVEEQIFCVPVRCVIRGFICQTFKSESSLYFKFLFIFLIISLIFCVFRSVELPTTTFTFFSSLFLYKEMSIIVNNRCLEHTLGTVLC